MPYAFICRDADAAIYFRYGDAYAADAFAY